MSNRNFNRLTPDLLLRAYTQGFFPMPDPDSNEVVWLRPKNRALIPLNGFHASRSLLKTIRKGHLKVTFDQAFRNVMSGCADRDETWITEEFFYAYSAMYEHGFAHSVEVWQGSELVGGLYGLAIGAAFFAESKFHRVDNASKVALYHLVKRLRDKGFRLLEVQFMTPHLASLGAKEVPDSEYQTLLQNAITQNVSFG